MNKVLYCDAGVSGNGTGIFQKGVAVGFYNGKPLFEINVDGKTNNEMEFIAFILTAGFAKKKDTVYCDSQLIVNLTAGNWQTKLPHLIKLQEIAKLILKSKNLKLLWTKREANEAGIYIEQKYSL